MYWPGLSHFSVPTDDDPDARVAVLAGAHPCSIGDPLTVCFFANTKQMSIRGFREGFSGYRLQLQARLSILKPSWTVSSGFGAEVVSSAE